MKIDVSKANEIIIRDADGGLIDRFKIGSISLIQDRMFGNILEVKRYKEKAKGRDENTDYKGTAPK